MRRKEKKELTTSLQKVVDRVFAMASDEHKKMTESYDRFAGHIWKEEELRKKDSRAFINYEFVTVETIAPLLTDNPPICKVLPKHGYLEKLAWVYNNALKYGWQTMDMARKTMLAVMDAMIAKIGIFKTYYNYEEDRLETEVVDPRNFFTLPGYDDLWKSPMCGTREPVPVTYIKQRWPDVKEITVDQSHFDDEKKSKVKFGDSEDHENMMRYAQLYSVWMKDESVEEVLNEEGKKIGEKVTYPYGKMVYFLSDQLLAVEPVPSGTKYPPFVPLYDYERPHNFLGISESDQIRGLNKELNLMLQHITGHIRKYHDPNYEVDVNCFQDPQTIKSQLQEGGGNVFMADKSMDPTRQGIRVIEEPGVSADVTNFFTVLPNIIETITGNVDILQGEPAKKERQSASEIAIQYEAANTRTRQRIRNLEWTIKRLGYLWVSIMQQEYSGQREFYTFDPETGEPVYERIGNSRAFAETMVRSPKTAEAMRGQKQLNPDQQREQQDYEKLVKAFGKDTDKVFFDFDIIIETNSTLPMDKQSRANMAMRLFEIGAIDHQALLEVLQWPNAHEIVARITQQMQEGAPPPQGGGNTTPFMRPGEGNV